VVAFLYALGTALMIVCLYTSGTLLEGQWNDNCRRKTEKHEDNPGPAKFWRSVFFPSSLLKTETARLSDKLTSTNQSTQRLNPKEHHQNHHCRENLKSHTYGLIWDETGHLPK
jgi:hypothetical protein